MMENVTLSFGNRTLLQRSSVNDNSTSRTSDSEEYFRVILPVVALVGIVGNVLNLIVLTRRRMVVGIGPLGLTANYGLIALAVSDLMFCLLVFPHGFITRTPALSDPLKMYYRLYGLAAINLFLMISTWLIVSMAVKRYLVVVYPLRARDHLTRKRTLVVIIAVYVTCVILTLPYFLHVKIVHVTDADGRTDYKFKKLSKSSAKAMLFYIRWIWPIIADFIPAFVLVFCNIRLIREIRGARLTRQSACPGQRVKDTAHRVTLTLVIIVLMLLVLVSPAEIVKYINPYKWGPVGHVIASVANLLQAVNFSFNFLLYFAVNAKFRQTLRSLQPSCLHRHLSERGEFLRVPTRTISRTSRLGNVTDELTL